LTKKCKKGWVFNEKLNKCVRGVDLIAVARKTKQWGKTKNLRKRISKEFGISGLE
tara:strand:+ start:250 stop:414 length:165 start_codon:yes stop_codon:yes gene_type:complete